MSRYETTPGEGRAACRRSPSRLGAKPRMAAVCPCPESKQAGRTQVSLIWERGACTAAAAAQQPQEEGEGEEEEQQRQESTHLNTRQGCCAWHCGKHLDHRPGSHGEATRGKYSGRGSNGGVVAAAVRLSKVGRAEGSSSSSVRYGRGGGAWCQKPCAGYHSNPKRRPRYRHSSTKGTILSALAPGKLTLAYGSPGTHSRGCGPSASS